MGGALTERRGRKIPEMWCFRTPKVGIQLPSRSCSCHTDRLTSDWALDMPAKRAHRVSMGTLARTTDHQGGSPHRPVVYWKHLAEPSLLFLTAFSHHLLQNCHRTNEEEQLTLYGVDRTGNSWLLFPLQEALSTR